MATEIKLPRLGQGMEAGTIVRWLKSEGDEVAKGEPLFELDTDKVTQEVEADAEGVLLKIVVPEGEANVGATVAVIGSADEDVSELLAGAQGGNGDAPAAAPAGGSASPRTRRLLPRTSSTRRRGRRARSTQCHKDEAAPSTGAGTVAAVSHAPAASPPVRAEGERVKASPLARRIARRARPRHRRADRHRARGQDHRGGRGAAQAPLPPLRLQLPTTMGAVEIVELTSIRRTIARRLTEAWAAPVFQLSVTADASALVPRASAWSSSCAKARRSRR